MTGQAPTIFSRPAPATYASFARVGRLHALLCWIALLTASTASAQFVEVAAHIEVTHWRYQEETGLALPTRRSYDARCVVGTNTWRIETDKLAGATEIFWFHEGKVIRQLVYKADPEETADPIADPTTETPRSALGGRYGRGRSISIFSALDIFLHGNLEARIPWFAFCSGSYLQQTNRPAPLPAAADGQAFGCRDETTYFTDALHLPRRTTFYREPKRLSAEYQTSASTNVAGWNFPTAFSLVQYQEDAFGQRQKQVTVTGLTSIKSAAEPTLPTDIQERLDYLEQNPTTRRPLR